MRDVNVERVLLVEQPNGRDMLKLGLEAAGFETDVADDAEAALSAAMAHARASLGGAPDPSAPGVGWRALPAARSAAPDARPS